MRFKDIPVPEVYVEESWDFRFFLKWFWECLTKIKYDTEHLIDIYDPLKCKEELLWLLGDTIGYKYDNRLPASFNRLVILNFMKMIKRKGSQTGVTFAAETNLAQFNLISYGAGYEDDEGNIVEGKDILYNRLEDTSIPVNSVTVTPHTREGYIDVVYFSTEKPIDACIEYVRPLGMYLFQTAGVRFDARTKISVDARLTNKNEYWESLGPTHVAPYSRDDYARMQKVQSSDTMSSMHVATTDRRKGSWDTNPDFELEFDKRIDPGYRALYSLQMCNNEHVVKSLIDPLFSLGYGPQKQDDRYSDERYYVTRDDVTVVNPKSYLRPPFADSPAYNLRYDRKQELDITPDVTTLDELNALNHIFETDEATGQEHPVPNILKPVPAVNPIMSEIGDAIAINDVIFTETSIESKLDYQGNDTSSSE